MLPGCEEQRTHTRGGSSFLSLVQVAALLASGSWASSPPLPSRLLKPPSQRASLNSPDIGIEDRKGKAVRRGMWQKWRKAEVLKFESLVLSFWGPGVEGKVASGDSTTLGGGVSNLLSPSYIKELLWQAWTSPSWARCWAFISPGCSLQQALRHEDLHDLIPQLGGFFATCRAVCLHMCGCVNVWRPEVFLSPCLLVWL